MLTNDRRCTCEIKARIAMAKAAFNKRRTNHQQMQKETFIINRNTLLRISTLPGHLQGERFCYPYTKVAFLSENVLLTAYCVVFGNNAVRSQQHILTQL
jgi:hypothetical protein